MISGNRSEKFNYFLIFLFLRLMLPCRGEQLYTENIRKKIPDEDRSEIEDSEIIGFIKY